MPRFLLTALIALALSLGGPLAPAAQAATTNCPPQPALGSTIVGNVVVPAGQTCTLDHVTVTGNVTAEPGSRLFLMDSTINGRFTATSSGISTTGSTVKGSLTISNGIASLGTLTVAGASNVVNDEGSIGILNSHFGGNLTLRGGSSFAGVAENQVVGNLTVNSYLIATVGKNHVGGKLSCSGNDQLFGSGNTANGGKFGQCAGI